MRVLENLEPKSVFHFFEDLTQIPRPSYHEKAVSDYLIRFAKDRGLECYQDDLYNVIIIKEASEGYEAEEPIILQGHMDMVCEKNPGVEKDMEKEGLDLMIDGDYVRAKGTTLGGDDGIAIAYALALLDSKTLKHPRLEFVCTVSEEVGMDGAHAIDLSPLKGHLLLNMDSENEGIVLAGCAGGGSANLSLPVKREACGWERVCIHIHKLAGGHSGTEINKGHASSVELTGRVLRGLWDVSALRLVSLENGSKDNAISREGSILLAVENKKAAEDRLAEIAGAVSAEYSVADPEVCIEFRDPAEFGGVPEDADPISEEDTKAVITLLTALPQGVQRMSDHVEGLVETSLNWGVATLHTDQFYMKSAIRSSVGTAKDSLIRKVRWIAENRGASCEMTGEYPAWEWVQNSPLRDKMARIYKEMFGKDLVIEAIHAGVECGLLADKIPNMDAISMGPDILDIHTPDEHLSISSVQRMWDYIVRIIEEK
ncbi:MAG: aminoacyl-histidine dipeptidase [Bilifractor sp.]|jgi:dipeptidase D